MKSFSIHNIPKVYAAIFFVFVFGGAILMAQFISQNETANQVIAEFGYVGVLILAIISGLNPVLPLPAATLTPLFTEAGLTIPLVIISLTIGTLIADFIGFSLGHISRTSVAKRYPKQFATFTSLGSQRKRLIFVFVSFYAALMPLPNEIILIPLAVAGVSFPFLLLPLFIGNLINQSLLVYGISSVVGIIF